MSVWDDPQLKAPGEEFAKLERQGDRISGHITDVRAHRFSDTDVAPQITFIDDQVGKERVWTAGQLQAKRQLADLRPEPGDWFSAELTRVEARSGGKTLKHIDVKVTRAGASEAIERLQRAHASSPVVGHGVREVNPGFEERPPF